MSVTVESPGAQRFRGYLTNTAMLSAYLAAKLPLAAFAGLKVTELDGRRCEVRIPFGWRTQNPFGSIYFAALSMAAEMSCAGLALSAARGAPRPVSVLPIRLEGDFEKKATGATYFVCEDGEALYGAVNEALATGEGVVRKATTVGRLKDGTVVARFQITWSFKEKKKK